MRVVYDAPELDARVLRIVKQRSPVAIKVVVEAANAPRPSVFGALKRLKAAGYVALRGERSVARWEAL